jgi:peptidoglycan/xylan/chitin deacetylase (PgdA/CDA1 family)
MTIAQLRELARSGVAIGAHTRTHRGLAYAPEVEQRAEIRRSRDDLASWLGTRPLAFAYPFGVPGADVDATTRRIVREEQFAVAVVNAPGAVRRDTDALTLPRWAPPDVGPDTFATALRGWLAR